MISQLPDSLNLGMAVPAAAIAIEAGLLIHDFYQRGVRTEYKGDVDLVTEADRASEKLIVAKLHDAFPSHGIFGEEGTRSGLEAEYRWYVDPLDGTTNFSHGFPYFCVSLGLEHPRIGHVEHGDAAGRPHDDPGDDDGAAERQPPLARGVEVPGERRRLTGGTAAAPDVPDRRRGRSGHSPHRGHRLRWRRHAGRCCPSRHAQTMLPEPSEPLIFECPAPPGAQWGRR